jgi:tetratricopeptide (TPR) repeat protein
MQRFVPVALCAAVAGVSWLLRAQVSAGADASALARGGGSMSEAHAAFLLVDYFKRLLEDHDLDAFRDRVASRYNEGTLARILSSSPTALPRRAAVVSLGLLGTFEASNAVLGRALRDADAGVRSMSEDALWAVWFRAGTPENNHTLQQVRILIGRQELDQAVIVATRLIAAAPNFAEAYNQRAIAYFLQNRLAESIEDCERVLSRNPCHFGAISGMAQCQLRLNRAADALKSFRRALRLQPYSEALKESVKVLEAETGFDGSP